MFSFLSMEVPEWNTDISVSSLNFLSDGNKTPFSNSPGYPLLAITTVIAFWGMKSMIISLRFF